MDQADWAAAAAAVFFVVFATRLEHPRRHYWRRWDRAAVVWRIMLPLCVVYGVAAVAGTSFLIGPAIHSVISSPLLTGVFTSAVTSLLLSPDALARERGDEGEAKDDDQSAQIAKAASVGRRLITAIESAASDRINASADHRVCVRVGDLDLRDLSRLGGRLHERYYPPGDRMCPVDRQRLLDAVRRAAAERKARHPRSAADVDTGDAALRTYAEDLIIRHSDYTIPMPNSVFRCLRRRRKKGK